MYTAVYMPANADYDPTMGGFLTEKSAYKWIFRRMCRACRKSRLAFLLLKRRGIDPMDFDEDEYERAGYPDEYGGGCSAMWSVMLTSEFEDCKSFDDIIDKTHGEPIYVSPLVEEINDA